MGAALSITSIATQDDRTKSGTGTVHQAGKVEGTAEGSAGSKALQLSEAKF